MLTVMIEFFPNSRAFVPTFHTNCLDGSPFAQMGSHFAQNTTPNPCCLLSRHTPLLEMCQYTEHPQAHPKTPHLLAWTWKWAKWTTVWAIQTQTGQNEKWAKLFWSGLKWFIWQWTAPANYCNQNSSRIYEVLSWFVINMCTVSFYW